MKSKNQSDNHCTQAQHAITLYYNLINAQDTSPVKNQQNVKFYETQGAFQNSSILREHFKTDLNGKILQNRNTPVEFNINNINTQNPDPWNNAFNILKEEIELRHYSPKTLKSYHIWARKFSRFITPKNPNEIVDDDLRNYLTYLTNGLKVSASSQRQAFNSLLFFFRHVLKMEPGDLSDTPRPKVKAYIPSVLSKEEVKTIIGLMYYPFNLMAKIMYGCGLRLSECMGIRVQDLNFDTEMLTVRRGKGEKDRVIPLPKSIVPELQGHLRRVRNLHRIDVTNAFDGVFMPYAFDKKAKNAATEFNWYWLFPAKSLTDVIETEEKRRYHQHETNFQKALKEASHKAQIPKRVSPHTLRHSFATHLLKAGYDIRQIQELLGHSDVRTTMIYTHTIKKEVKEVKSPLDF